MGWRGCWLMWVGADCWGEGNYRGGRGLISELYKWNPFFQGDFSKIVRFSKVVFALFVRFSKRKEWTNFAYLSMGNGFATFVTV